MSRSVRLKHIIWLDHLLHRVALRQRHQADLLTNPLLNATIVEFSLLSANRPFVTSDCERESCDCCLSLGHTKQHFRLPGLFGVSVWCLSRDSEKVLGDFNSHSHVVPIIKYDRSSWAKEDGLYGYVVFGDSWQLLVCQKDWASVVAEVKTLRCLVGFKEVPVTVWQKREKDTIPIKYAVGGELWTQLWTLSGRRRSTLRTSSILVIHWRG